MIKVRGVQFSLLTLFLLLTIAALSLSNVIMSRRLDRATREVEQTRRHFGFVEVDYPQMIYVARIEAPGKLGEEAWRLIIPPGHHYLLNVAETNISDRGEFDTPQPAASLSMNPWREGADVVLRWHVQIDDDGTSHLKVLTQSEQLFDYPIQAWKSWTGMHDSAGLSSDLEKYDPEEEIRFMWMRDVATKRGVVFWMEPVSRRYPEK